MLANAMSEAQENKLISQNWRITSNSWSETLDKLENLSQRSKRKKPCGDHFPNEDISRRRGKSNMEEETQTKEKVETDMEEENKNTVATTTMKTQGGMKILQNGDAKNVV